LRQYARASDVSDLSARAIEAEALCDRIKWLLYHHLELRVGMSDHDWVWLNCHLDDCCVERSPPSEVHARGRIECTLAEGPRKAWTEPFAAKITQSPTGSDICDYSLWFGGRATMLDLETVRKLITAGNVLDPPAPVDENGWAFAFRMGDRA